MSEDLSHSIVDETSLGSRSILRVRLLDAYPDDRLMQNVVLLAYDIGIVQSIDRAENLDQPFLFKMCRLLDRNYGLNNSSAVSAVKFWVLEYGVKYLGRKHSIDFSAGQATADTVRTGVIRPATSDHLGTVRVLSAQGVDYAFRWCPAGEFMMGSPSTEDGRYYNEEQHRVILTRGFFLLETPVTQRMWESVMGTTIRDQRDKAGPDRSLCGVGPSYPMYYVNWEESRSFCTRLSALLGERISLPTESQWEYGCRAGSTGPYSGTGCLNEMGWYVGNSGGSTHEVKGKKPNAWGLYDMHGNVWEWCSDWKGAYPQGTVTDSEGPSEGSARVYRGGRWNNRARGCRSADRTWGDPAARNCYLGFRPVLVPARD